MDKIEKYINSSYSRWLDYSTYHCTQAGIPDEAVDVLNEVLLSLLQKPREKLLTLMGKVHGKYTELDFFVLRMIKLNAQSETAPYRARYKPMPVDRNVDYTRLDIEDELTDQTDSSGYIYQRMSDLRQMISDMGFGPNAIAIFEYKFFHKGDFRDWTGPETVKELYIVYSRIKKTITSKNRGEIIF